MKKLFLLLLLPCLFLITPKVHAEFFDASRVVDDWGDLWITNVLATSTDTVVLISSPSPNALSEDIHRVVVIENIGGDEMVLYPNNTDFVIYESTRGIHLSSYTLNAPWPRSHTFYGTQSIFTIWNTGGTETNAGARINKFENN